MKEDKNNPFNINVDDNVFNNLKLTYKPQYKINVDNIKTIKDIKLILQHLDLHYTPDSPEDYEEIKHLLILN